MVSRYINLEVSFLNRQPALVIIKRTRSLVSKLPTALSRNFKIFDQLISYPLVVFLHLRYCQNNYCLNWSLVS